MDNKKSIVSKYRKLISDKYYLILILIFTLGFFVRFYQLDILPLGLNQDEAYSGYEAYSLLNYGVDSHGYSNPVYFVSWGSGMNVLYSYLTIPFIFLAGNKLTPFVIRLPQAFFACLSLIAFYYLLKHIYVDRKLTLLGLFIFAITPWHIMLAHWGLESNIAPAFLLFGLLFFIKAFDNSKFYILSFLFYGLSLYAYAPLWFALPVILFFNLVYCIYCKKFKWDKFFTLAVIVLFVLALPLMLFLLINNGIIGELKTNIISIPKLLEYRGGEVSIHNVKTSIYHLYTLFIKQNDDLIWNATKEFGLFYKFSNLFVVVGFCSIAGLSFNSIKNKKYHPFTLVLTNIFVGLIWGLFISSVNINKINLIHIPLILCWVQGIITTSKLFKKPIYSYIIFVYLVSFVAFSSFYFNIYHLSIQKPFQYGVMESVQAAISKTDSTICVNKDIYYSNVLFASKLPVTNYLASVSYDPNLPNDYTPLSFDRFTFGYDIDNLNEKNIYIISNDEINIFMNEGYTIETFGNYSVASFVTN